MRLTQRAVVLLVAGVLGWGATTGIAVAAVADVGPQGAGGVPGVAGAPGAPGRDGVNGVDNTVVGPRGRVGEKGPVGGPGPKGSAYQPTTHTVFRRSSIGDYSGPTVRAETGVQMRMKYNIVCNSYFPFLSLTWHGDGLGDYDYVRVDSGNVMSGSQYLNPTSNSGSFEIRTQDDCAWTVTVTQKY